MPLQWEGIYDHSVGLPVPVWMARWVDKPETNKWLPLTPTDCDALNKSTASSIHIEGGRATVSNNRIRYNFVRGREREVDFATWFVADEEKGPIPIFEEHDAESIEALYQAANSADSLQEVLDRDVILSDGQYKAKVVKLNQNGTKLEMRKISTGWGMGTRFQLQRGYGAYDGPADYDGMLGPARHLVFVVHGIGEHLFCKDHVKWPSIVETMEQMRRGIQEKQVAQWEELKGPCPDRIELIPVEWYDKLHDSSTSLMRSLRATTLQTIPALRSIANDVILDVLLYMTPAFCEATLECVTAQIHELYHKFLQVHPDFITQGGTVSLTGHSLGSVIVWDMLSILKEKESKDSKQCQSESLGPRVHGVAVQPEDQAADVGYQAYAGHDITTDGKVQMGTWGPSVTKSLEQTIPFRPRATILLGSPLGLFLTLRGAHPVFDAIRQSHRIKFDSTHNSESGGLKITPEISPFSLPTGCLFNIFHPSDPVAYRVEPLLLSTDFDPIHLPAPLYLTALGKDVRLHIKAKQLHNQLRKSVLDSKSSWNVLLTSAVAALKTDHTTHCEATESGYSPSTLSQPIVFPLGGTSERVDFYLQTGVINNEYISAVVAHSTYFTNADIQSWIASLLQSSRTPDR